MVILVNKNDITSCLYVFNSLWPSDAIWWQIWVNIGLVNGLSPYGTKPLPEPVLCGIHLRAILKKVLMNLIFHLCSDIFILTLWPHLPGPVS